MHRLFFNIALNCPLLQAPANGIVDILGRTAGSQAVYSCDGGFGINGSRILTCGANTTWDASPPTCISVTSVTCPDLMDPIDGTVSITSRNLDGSALYQCDSGFSLAGSLLRLCHASESWSGSAPTCQRESSFILFFFFLWEGEES